MNRREFLRAGATLTIGFYLPRIGVADAPQELFAPNAFIRITPDGVVRLIIGRSEMGQGVHTSLAMLIAEELEADWKSIRVEAAPVGVPYYNPILNMQLTGGSTSVRSSWRPLREAGAAARTMLIAAAAKRWNVDPETCRAENGEVIHVPSARRVGYGPLVRDASKLDVPKNVTMKSPREFKIIGKRMPRVDAPDKVRGRAEFGIDACRGFLQAVIARPPVFGAKLRRFDATAARAIAGVKHIVEIPSGLAVVADSFWTAQKARDAVRIEWTEGNASINSDALRREYLDDAKRSGIVAKRTGDPESALASAEKSVDVIYELPFLAHATMEPLNCAVDFRGDRAEIVTGTQNQSLDREKAAAILGIDPSRVTLRTPFLGGGFGRRGTPTADFVVEAVHLAKAIRQPVKVLWTREDDVRHDVYRPMAVHRMRGGLRDGNVTAWMQTIVTQSIFAGTEFESWLVKNGIDETSVDGATDMSYAPANLQIDLHSPKPGVPSGAWRSVGNSHNGFAIEAFVDELAAAARKDPVAFRLAMLANQPRLQAAIRLAAAKAGWGTPLPKGCGRGIAAVRSFGTCVAEVAEVDMRGSEPKVTRVVCAVDCGTAVNPAGVEAQMESGILFGLTAALFGEITLAKGGVEQSNFNDYRMLRLSEAPRIEVHIIASSESPTGTGEPGVPPIAPAVANAIFAATGKRLRRLPFT